MVYPVELEPNATLVEIFKWLAMRADDQWRTHTMLADTPEHPSNQGRGEHLADHLESHRIAAEINCMRAAGWHSRARKLLPRPRGHTMKGAS